MPTQNQIDAARKELDEVASNYSGSCSWYGRKHEYILKKTHRERLSLFYTQKVKASFYVEHDKARRIALLKRGLEEGYIKGTKVKVEYDRPKKIRDAGVVVRFEFTHIEPRDFFSRIEEVKSGLGKVFAALNKAGAWT